ncbi:putative protein N(5)-glutamine methyltransferase [Cellulomonas shaoxiangyii]|uniref:Uncharacterized protein n=1 Tax=Cellulomonas shaoxiangyii TaxID=2566013 RepID=A0A4P7SKL9_9CELL|nr:putative protein N(5)-glutamine methyltransferase [Cellulomonas shaoxiangyii]QCB94421.1 putative protein N(5)-glutamine methyltransferase [Cellulomonas shaoxiangyii]TGY79628.1 putative protein N(5)-glutamine methyltransferase [Cellulomonas shaoxiangyii]
MHARDATGAPPPGAPSPGPAPARLASVVTRLRAAGCVFAEDEAALLLAAALAAGRHGTTAADGTVRTAPSPATADEVLEGLVARRVTGEPLETVLGWVGFAGLRLAVGAGVFVPRRRTELLARTAVRLARGARPSPVVVEACCGVAPVATLVAHEVPGADVHAADLDPAATGWAARNLAGRGRVWTGDLLDPLPGTLRGRVDVLVANAPYVPHAAIATMPPEAREHEPHVALDGGPDGVAVQRRLLAAAPAWVRAGGHVLVETSVRQAPLTRAACPPGWTVDVLRDDDVDGTVVVARRPG